MGGDKLIKYFRKRKDSNSNRSNVIPFKHPSSRIPPEDQEKEKAKRGMSEPESSIPSTSDDEERVSDEVISMLHEMHNPLSAIVASTDYLMNEEEKLQYTHKERKDVKESSVRRHHLQGINEAATRISTLTREFVSRPQRPPKRKELVDMHILINNAIHRCEHLIQTRHIKIYKNLYPELPIMRGFPHELTQAFINLLTNACQAIPIEGGDIHVCTSLMDTHRHIRIDIIDNGCGVPKGLALALFDPFISTKKEIGGGMGCGLTIVQEVAQMHEGTIELVPHPWGTCFALTLPLHGTACLIPPTPPSA